MVYDPKVSSFLQYIGQDLFLDLKDAQPEALEHLIDQAAERREDKAFRLESVQKLRALERCNRETAAELLGLSLGGEEA